MSNIAGKSYAMNVITPIKGLMFLINKLIFWAARTILSSRLDGLKTLSLIHYARWVIIRPSEFPNLGHGQPKEELKYSYMIFFSNFNGSWAQYVDSFSMAISNGLNLLWMKNVKYPNSIPLTPFHNYITFNQIWTNHYYNAYPMATSNDVKSGKFVKARLLKFMDKTESASAEKFQDEYNRMLFDLQYDLSQMARTPVVSLASQAIEERRRKQAKNETTND